MIRAVTIVLCLAAAGAAVAADSFPLFQSALVDKSGVIRLIQTVEGQAVEREARKDEPWLPGERLVVGNGKNFSAKVAISDLVLLGFDDESSATLQPGPAPEGMTPPVVELESGSFFYKMQKNATQMLTVIAGPFKVETKSGAGYVSLKGDKFQVICGGGAVTVLEGRKRQTVGKGEGYSGRVAAKSGAVKPLPKEVIGKLAKAFRVKLPDSEIPVLPDRIGPKVTIVAPKGSAEDATGTVEVVGTVNDPSVEKVKVLIGSDNRGLFDVQAGQFRLRVKLYDSVNTITIVAQDLNKVDGSASVVVRCSKPLVKPQADKPDEPESALTSAWNKLRKAATDPQNPMVFIGLVLLGGLLLFIGYLIIRKIYRTSKKSLQKASELATGIVFQRCEKCGNREYHYHLFYTTESVNSPFLRNLINNVNPMATSMMNESLESLLSTGLKWSQKAKAAENKIRVICSWCDFCKTGTLSLEHMQGDAVTKVDDYQIIHPIFIEWVRKVYD